MSRIMSEIQKEISLINSTFDLMSDKNHLYIKQVKQKNIKIMLRFVTIR